MRFRQRFTSTSSRRSLVLAAAAAVTAAALVVGCSAEPSPQEMLESMQQQASESSGDLGDGGLDDIDDQDTDEFLELMNSMLGDPVEAMESQEQRQDAREAEDAADDAAEKERALHEGLLAEIPAVDGEAHGKNQSDTDANLTVITGKAWDDVVAEARQKLGDADFTERAWAVDENNTVMMLRAVVAKEPLVVRVQVGPDGTADYRAKVLPAGSDAETQDNCIELQQLPMVVPMMSPIDADFGDPNTPEEVAWTFAFVDALEGHVPDEVWASVVALRDTALDASEMPTEEAYELFQSDELEKQLQTLRADVQDYCAA